MTHWSRDPMDFVAMMPSRYTTLGAITFRSSRRQRNLRILAPNRLRVDVLNRLNEYLLPSLPFLSFPRTQSRIVWTFNSAAAA
jgi:hypothetical protein